jgi:hypothetical protein
MEIGNIIGVQFPGFRYHAILHNIFWGFGERDKEIWKEMAHETIMV